MALAEKLKAAGAAITAGRAMAAALTVSFGGAALIISHEGTESRVYLDPVGIPTVCTGHTATVSQKDVGKTFSSEVCANLLRQDLRVAEAAVKKCTTVPITQEQYDALVSFTFNVGGGAYCRSTLARRLNAGRCTAAGDQFLRWNKAGGKVLPGLTRRRAEERTLFMTGCKENS
jgi:lysozyme